MRTVALPRHSQFSKCERGSQTPERAGPGSISEPLTRFSAEPQRSVPGYAFPFTELLQRIQKRARPQPALTADRVYMLTPDWWESARFRAVCVARSWFRQSGGVSSQPPTGNANRWAIRARGTINKGKYFREQYVGKWLS